MQGGLGVLVAATVLVGACTPAGPRGLTADGVCEVPPPLTLATHLATEEEASMPMVIVQTRDHEIMVYPARGGLEFTVVLAGSGTVLASRVSEQAFRRGFPGLHAHFESAFADEHGHAGASWAGL